MNSIKDLNHYQLDKVAYVKQMCQLGIIVHGIFAVDGTCLTTVTSRDLAFATVKQHDMEPVSVH